MLSPCNSTAAFPSHPHSLLVTLALQTVQPFSQPVLHQGFRFY
jgi:hypothetical protein